MTGPARTMALLTYTSQVQQQGALLMDFSLYATMLLSARAVLVMVGALADIEATR